MSEEVKDEQSETVDEKSLEDQIAALEDIASALKDEAKSDDENVEEKSDDEEVSEAKSDDDDAEEKGLGEADHSEEECKDMEKCPWHSVDAKKAEESDGEEKSAASNGDEEKAHAVVTGHPYDRIVLKPGDPEFDEDVEKGYEEDPHEVPNEAPKKRRIVVVEMDPSQVTEDMKAFEVEIDEEEEEEQPYPLVDEEEKRRVPMPPPGDDEEDERAPLPRAVAPPSPPPPPPGLNPTPTPDRLPPPPGAAAPEAPIPAANPRLARLLAMASQARERPEEEEEERNVGRLPKAVLVRKDDEEEVVTKDDSPLMDPLALSSRLKRLGYTAEQVKSFTNKDFVCAIERKVRSSDVCNFCRGGCASEKGLPGLLEIEVAAEAEHKGEVVDSGYAPKDDIFVLDLKTNDGFVEAYYAGNGSPLGWIMLDGDVTVKSADSEDSVAVVSFNEAEQVALKNIKGKSLGVDVDIFLGEDAYVVEIDGVDGKSYDAYVSVDGKFLGSDEIEFTEDEAEEITVLRMEKESLESELRLKRAYASADTEQMAEDGVAMAGGAYPILTSDDLFDAIRINYRAKSSDLRQHIEQRAEHLKRVDLLPPEWAEKAAEEAEFVSSLMELEMLEAELPE